MSEKALSERPSLLWLLVEIPLAAFVSFIPTIWNGALDERSLTHGIILATLIVMIPSEFLRHFVGPKKLRELLGRTTLDRLTYAKLLKVELERERDLRAAFMDFDSRLDAKVREINSMYRDSQTELLVEAKTTQEWRNAVRGDLAALATLHAEQAARLNDWAQSVTQKLGELRSSPTEQRPQIGGVIYKPSPEEAQQPFWREGRRAEDVALFFAPFSSWIHDPTFSSLLQFREVVIGHRKALEHVTPLLANIRNKQIHEHGGVDVSAVSGMATMVLTMLDSMVKQLDDLSHRIVQTIDEAKRREASPPSIEQSPRGRRPGSAS